MSWNYCPACICGNKGLRYETGFLAPEDVSRLLNS
jgi:hypothetical protein